MLLLGFFYSWANLPCKQCRWAQEWIQWNPNQFMGLLKAHSMAPCSSHHMRYSGIEAHFSSTMATFDRLHRVAPWSAALGLNLLCLSLTQLEHETLSVSRVFLPLLNLQHPLQSLAHITNSSSWSRGNTRLTNFMIFIWPKLSQNMHGKYCHVEYRRLISHPWGPAFVRQLQLFERGSIICS